MPGPIAILEGGVECRMCDFVAEADTDSQAEAIANKHMDEAHPEVSDDTDD